MKKENFLKLFPQENTYAAASIWEDIVLCKEIEYVVYSNEFLPPYIWKKLLEIQGQLGIKLKVIGDGELTERAKIAWMPKDFPEEEIYFSASYFKIDGTSKFKELSHKNFLGTIMSLGLKRELLSDLVVQENICYGIAAEEIFPLLKSEIKSINGIPVAVSEISMEEFPKPKFKEIVETVPSLRLDALVSACAGVSRGTAEKIIAQGDVLIDYVSEKKDSRPVREGAVITIKKIGKFIFKEILGETRKEKVKIRILKYI